MKNDLENKVMENEDNKDIEINLEEVGNKVVGGANLKVTPVKSPIGHPSKRRKAVAVLGLKKVSQAVMLPDNAADCGQIIQVKHKLEVEEAN